MGTGVFLVLGATVSWLFPAALAIGLVGACAGMSYVTGFTTLQESVHDELRGRTFATLYTVIRLCLLLTLVVSPLWADFWEWLVGLFAAGPPSHDRRRELRVPWRARRALGRRAHDPRRGRVGTTFGARGRAAAIATSVPRDRCGGRFVVLEGGDATGKSTQIERLAERLRAPGLDVVSHVRAGRDAARSTPAQRCCSTARTRSTRSPRR